MGQENIKPEERLQIFKSQIERDLEDIKVDYERLDKNTSNPDYAFIYWVLLKLYSIDDENIKDNITEYNDKSIDCFVHFEETKELFIIQCKHYDEDTKVIRNMVADFLKTPLAVLDKGEYKKSIELQKIYNKAMKDSEYKIYLQFYTTNQKYSEDIGTLITDFNTKARESNKNFKAEFLDLKDIYSKYYGESYKPTKNLTFSLKTINKGTFASVKEEYGINYKYLGYYIITPVSQIYELIKTAKTKGYQLFEENIREYLGESGSINKAIGDTLRSESDRLNFLYYNNGITMIVKSAKQKQVDATRCIALENPQIVNGCQTVNTIYSVLDGYSEKERAETFKDVFVMTKLLIIPTNNEKDVNFYHDVVKYTNKQNPIPDKVFTASNQTVFQRIQTEIKRYGLWIKVKQSDKIKFDNDFSSKEKADMLDRAKTISDEVGIKITQKDLCVDLEKLLQVALAYITDGYVAFTKKSSVLKPNTEIFKKYSINIQDYLSYENLVRLYFIYKRAENDRKHSDDLRTPIPYYILSFLSYHIKFKNDPANFNLLLDRIFNEKKIDIIYPYLVNLCKGYKRDMKKDYNVLIKTKIDSSTLDNNIETAKDYVEEAFNFLTKQE